MVKTDAGNTVLIVQAMAFTKYLGHIKVEIVFCFIKVLFPR